MKLTQALLLLLYCWCGITAGSASDTDEVRSALQSFKKAVETGDAALAEKVASRNFSASLIPFCRSLSNNYFRNKIPFPLEIGQVKILQDGRAKVETFLTEGRNLFVFTLKREESSWRICHMECIRFPLYSIPTMPWKDMYQIPADQLKWMQAEREVNFNNLVYDRLERGLGEKAAEEFFLDGAGNRVAVDAWLPFIEGAAQFASFYAILEENYFGSVCTILRASEEEADILCAPLAFLEVYARTFATPRMPLEKYKKLYEKIMQNRAASCGLELQLSYDGNSCRIKVKKKRI